MSELLDMAIEEVVLREGRQGWFWLSFADGDRPKGQQFLGVAVVRAAGFIAAVSRAHELGINPGGECRGQELPAHVPPPDELLDRLLTDKARIVELEQQWSAASREAAAKSREASRS